jgi:hypothetical protein
MPVRKIPAPIVTPIPQPDLTPQQGRPNFLSRRVCLNMEDWRAFGDALQVACPYGRYLGEQDEKEPEPTHPPSLQLRPHIADALADTNAANGTTTTSVFDPDWRLEYRKKRYTWGYAQAKPDPKFYMQLSGRVWKEEKLGFEYMNAGLFVMAVSPGNESHMAFSRAFFSLFGKFASKRHQCSVSFPDYEHYDHKATGDIWIGHHTIRWLLADPTRLIGFVRFPRDPTELADPNRSIGCGYRPIEDKWRAKLGL